MKNQNSGFKLFQIAKLEGQVAIELSFSKISAYEFCPWKYKLLYVDGYRVPPNAFISLGLTIHHTLEKYHGSEQQSLNDLIDFYNEAWVNEGFISPQQTQEFYDRGLSMLKKYFEFTTQRKTKIIAIEKEFHLPLGTRTLRGIIDRIDLHPDGKYEIIDYKTHSELWTKEKIDNDFQLTYYALGARKALEIVPQKLSYFFLSHNQILSTDPSEEKEKLALEKLEFVAKKIEERDYTARTENCTRCDFKATCKFSILKVKPSAPNK